MAWSPSGDNAMFTNRTNYILSVYLSINLYVAIQGYMNPTLNSLKGDEIGFLVQGFLRGY